MSVFYHVVGRKNPMVLGEVKYYAQANSVGEQSFDDVCQTIADRSAMTKGDVMSALDGLIFSMIQALRNGQSARLGEFGSFRVTIKSNGADAPDVFSANMIKKGRIVFAPGKRLKDALTSLSFRLKASPTAPGGEPDSEE